MNITSSNILDKLKGKFSSENLKDLKELTKHDGWKVLIELAELHKIELWLSVSNIDFDDEKQVKVLSNQQIYLNAMMSVLKMPSSMDKNLETFQEYDESDIMPVYDKWF